MKGLLIILLSLIFNVLPIKASEIERETKSVNALAETNSKSQSLYTYDCELEESSIGLIKSFHLRNEFEDGVYINTKLHLEKQPGVTEEGFMYSHKSNGSFVQFIHLNTNPNDGRGGVVVHWLSDGELSVFRCYGDWAP